MNTLIRHVRRLIALSALAVALVAGPPAALALQTPAERTLHAERVVVRALTFMRTGNPDRAVDTYAEGLRVNPDEPVLLSGMADAQEAAGDLASARFYAGRAVERAPNNPTYLEQLARISTAAGDMEAALAAWSRLSDAAPDLIAPGLRHIELLARLDFLDEAVDRADVILEHHPSHAPVLEVQADLLHRAGRTEREIVVLRRLLDVRPTRDARYDLAVALERSGDSNGALDILIDVLASDPDDMRFVELFLSLSSRPDVTVDPDRLPSEVAALVDTGSPADSTAVYARRLESDPNDSSSAAALARLLAAEGRFLEAADVLVRQTDRDPRRPDLWISAVDHLIDAGEFDRAVDLGEEASFLYPGFPPLALPYATALRHAGRDADALEVAQKARASIDASNPLAASLDTLIAELEKPQ